MKQTFSSISQQRRASIQTDGNAPDTRRRTPMTSWFLLLSLVVLVLTPTTRAATTSTTQTKTTLLFENPRVSIEYAVITPESDIENDLFSSQNAIDAGGILEVRLEYEGEGWAAVGWSETGYMIGSEAVIGLPSTDLTAAEKHVVNGYSPTAIERRADEMQTLFDATVEQQDGITILKFGKLLRESDEFLLDISSSDVLTNLIWAVGSSNQLGYHVTRGSISASLYDAIVPAAAVVVQEEEDPTATTAEDAATTTPDVVDLQDEGQEPSDSSTTVVVDEEEEVTDTTATEVVGEEDEDEDVVDGNEDEMEVEVEVEEDKDEVDEMEEDEEKEQEASKDTAGLSLLVVSEDPKVSIEYSVLTADSGADLPLEAIAAGGVLDVRFVYEGEGWISFGISQSGQMIGSEAIIGVPSSAGDVTVPEKYALNAFAVSGIERMPDDRQTLIDATLTQEDGITTMSFKKLLLEEGELPLTLGEDNHFVWAIGSQNILGYHAIRSNYVASLEVCVDSSCSGDSSTVRLGSTEIPNKGMWRAHGGFATLAWGICAPLAIASSIIRNLITVPGLWFKIHLYLNLLCVLFTILLFAVAIAATKDVGAEHFAGTHQKIGLSVFIISLFQVVMGMTRPHPPGPVTHHNDSKDGSNNEDDVENGPPKSSFSKNPMDDSMAKETAATPQRKLFAIGHRLVGGALILLSFHNINSGMELYAMRYNDGEDATPLFWKWIGILLCSVTALKLYSKFRKTTD